MADCPPDEKGYRPEFQIIAFHERQQAFSSMREGFKRVRMHRSKYLRWLEDEEPWTTPEERVQRWDELCMRQKGTPDRTEDGPAMEPTRAKVLAEDYDQGEFCVNHLKELHLQTKAKMIKDQNQIEELRLEVNSGHVSFENDMFKGVGGGHGIANAIGQRRALGHNFGGQSEAVEFGKSACFKSGQQKKH